MTKSHYTVVGVVFHTTYILFVGSYTDSERVDMTVTVERPDHTFLKLEYKDVPVIIELNHIPTATINVGTPDEPVGVPTVEVREKGGKKEAVHSYK